MKHLLLLGCSRTKNPLKGNFPAIEIYNGTAFKVLRHFLKIHGWQPNLHIRILSGKYGLIDARFEIKDYDEYLTDEKVLVLRQSVMEYLKKEGKFESIFINMGRKYRLTTKEVEPHANHLFIPYAPEGMAQKNPQMIQWLNWIS